MIWIIKGKDLPTLEIIADSFDEALAIARKDNQDLRAIAFRWFCIKHKIKLIDLLDLLDKTNYSPTQSAVKLGIKKGELKKNEKSI